jgi:hypothetical protein
LPRPAERPGTCQQVQPLPPAAELLRHQAALIPEISLATLDKASLLFKRINEMTK